MAGHLRLPAENGKRVNADARGDDDARRIWMRGREVLLTSAHSEASAPMVLPPPVRMPVYATCNGRDVRTEETIYNASEWPAIKVRVARWLMNRRRDPFA